MRRLIMLLINWLIKISKIDMSDYYRHMIENPASIMLRCKRCPQYDNNGCGTCYIEQVDCQSNQCDIRRGDAKWWF